MSPDFTARGLAALARQAAQGYNRSTLVLLGDSRLAQLHVDSAGSRMRKFGGNFLTQAMRLTGQRVKVEKSFATSGQRSDQYLSEANVTAALACKSHWLVIYGVLNDIAQLGDNDYFTANIRPVVERWTATGRQVILPTETGANSLTGAQRGAVFKYNRQIRDYARQNRGVIIFDVASIVMQPTSTMTITAAYTTDGTHIDTVAGGYAVGAKFADLVKQLAPPCDGLVYAAGQTFANGGVQLFDNPVFTGTDSTAVGILSGTKPTGVTSATGPAGSSITSSIAAGPYGNDWQLAITAGAGGTVTVSVPPTSSSYWVRGNTYFGNIAADVVAGHSNFQGICLHQETNNGTSTFNTDDGYLTGAAGNLPAGAYSDLTLETEWLPIGAGTGGWYTNQFLFYFTAAGSATVKLRRLGINRLMS